MELLGYRKIYTVFVKGNVNKPVISRKPQYKDIYRRTIEMPQRARIFSG